MGQRVRLGSNRSELKGTFWGDGNIPYLDWGGRYTSRDICQKSSDCALASDTFIACKLYLNKVGKI